MKHYSQRDQRWTNNIIGFSDTMTIGKYGCLLSCVAMVCTDFGREVNPGDLNEMYRNVGGFEGANLIVRLINSIYPDIYQREFIVSSKDIDAPLSLIDSYLNDGIPVIVQVDYSKDSGLQSHWVVLTENIGGDYTMYDPYELSKDDDSLVQAYGHSSLDPAHIITSVLVLGHKQAAVTAPVYDEYNASVVALYGAAVRFAPRVSHDTLVGYLTFGTRVLATDEVVEADGYTWRKLALYMAEADADGTEILRLDDGV